MLSSSRHSGISSAGKIYVHWIKKVGDRADARLYVYLFVGTVDMKERYAYEGEKYSIEWYYDEDAESEAFQYFEGLSDDEQADALALFKWMATLGKIQNKEKFRHEGDQIYAFKPRPHRFLCFFVKGRKIIVTNAFFKDTDKLPPEEKKKAQRRRKDYENRVKERNYYEADDL